MPFWSTNFGQDPTLKDPKRKHRFTVEFQGINAAQGGALLWYAKTATKPGFEMLTLPSTSTSVILSITPVMLLGRP